jgi:hypothetical protein
MPQTSRYTGSLCTAVTFLRLRVRAIAVARDDRAASLHALGDFAQEDDIDVLVNRGDVFVGLHRLHVRVHVELLADGRHDPGWIVARIRVVADGASNETVGLAQTFHRHVRHRMAVQLVTSFPERELAPVELEPDFDRGRAHHLDCFGNDFEADVVAQHVSDLQHCFTPSSLHSFTALLYHSPLILASLMTFAHRSYSARTNFPNSAGVLGVGSSPTLLS